MEDENMKKLISKFILIPTLLILAISTNLPTAIASDENQDTLLYNLDQPTTSVSDSLNTIESHLRIPGNSVIFEGNEINKLALYKDLFRPLNIPLFLEDNEYKTINPDAIISDVEDNIDGLQNIVVPTKTTLIALYNANGKITVLQNDEPIEESVSKIQSFNSYVFTDNKELFIDEFKQDMDQLYSEASSVHGKISLAAGQGDILETVRKTLSVNGSYTAIGGTKVSYVAGKAVTDYVLYANSKGTHFYVLADSQVHPAGVASSNNSVWTTGYKSNIRTNSSTNSLINWSPDTTGYNLNSNDTYQFGITAGTSGIDVNFSYTWTGSSSSKMDSVGSKTTGLTTQYIYKNNGSAIASNAFTTKHGALIQATNKVLSFSSSHQFRNENMFNSGNVWYSTSTTNLSYTFR